MSNSPRPAHSDTRIDPTSTTTLPSIESAPFTISVPITGTFASVESIRSPRSSSLSRSSSPSVVTKASSSGNSEKNPL